MDAERTQENDNEQPTETVDSEVVETPEFPVLRHFDDPPTPAPRKARLITPAEFESRIRTVIEKMNADQSTETKNTLEENSTMGPRFHVPPPIFSAASDEDIQEFLDLYENISRLNSWGDDKKVSCLILGLRGQALQWYSNEMKNQRSWSQWKEALIKAFRTQNFRELAHIRLLQRVQTLTESPETYFHDVIRMCNRIDPEMSDEGRIRHLLRGLQPGYLQIMMLSCPSTPDKFLQQLQQISRTQLMMKYNPFVLGCNATTLPTPEVSTQFRPGIVNLPAPTFTVPYGPSATTSKIPSETPMMPYTPVSAPPPSAPATVVPVHFQETATSELMSVCQKISATLKQIEKKLEQPPATTNPGIRSSQDSRNQSFGSGGFRRFPPRGDRNFAGTVRCHECGRFGHIRLHCPGLRRPVVRDNQHIDQVSQTDLATQPDDPNSRMRV